MSEILIRINTDNAAFRNKESEIKRILNKVKDNLDIIIDGEIFNLRDINGNRVGIAKTVSSLTIEDLTELIEGRIKNNVEPISEKDILVMILTYLRAYWMER